MNKTVGMLFLSAGVLLCVGLNSSNSYANQAISTGRAIKLCDFAPINNRKIPIAKSLADATGIDEKTFNQVIDDFIKVYDPIVQAHGGVLQINRLWDDDTVNANTTLDGNVWAINAFGGLARYKGMTYDGFMAVLCHEMGHHLGGYPRFTGNDWASVEGQADYFAMMKGFRTVFQNADNSAVLATLSVPKIVVEKCSTQHKAAPEIALCERGSMAGLTLGQVLNDLGGSGVDVAFDTPDQSQVTETFEAHPQAQCRLDTYFNGAICGVSQNEEFGVDNASTGACAEERGDHFGVRSRCWYMPSQPSFY